MSLSPLRSHKFRHNFTDTPSEIYRCNQGIEDTNHFLFLCPNYATPRATLAASIINILQKNNLNYLGNQSKLYLYGHPTIISSENRKSFCQKLNIYRVSYVPQLKFNTAPPPFHPLGLNISGLFTSLFVIVCFVLILFICLT